MFSLVLTLSIIEVLCNPGELLMFSVQGVCNNR